MLGSPDHPRACGELPPNHASSVALFGSSPRMRGTLARPISGRQSVRIIPAHAGNSRSTASVSSSSTDHPRACGELAWSAVGQVGLDGSSPRMRGTPSVVGVASDGTRIIPAHAGNSLRSPGMRPHAPDHPRACGELPGIFLPRRSIHGSSPRMRGTPGGERVGGCVKRIIPAHAGNSVLWSEAYLVNPDHPRACGELRT